MIDGVNSFLSRIFRSPEQIAADQAEALKEERFAREGATISLLHATRGRVKKAHETRDLWLSLAKDPGSIEHIFAFDSDDKPSRTAMRRGRHVEIAVPGTCVKAWNAAAQKSRGAILLQLSDDWIPVQNWDELILARLDPAKPQVLAISDGYRKDRLLCMAILTRKRYEQQGYMFHPEFESMFSDDWFTHAAYKDGVVVEARDIVFTHDHPHRTNVEMDATYQRNNLPERYHRGEATFQRLCQEIYGE
jgi:hypothetical protein